MRACPLNFLHFPVTWAACNVMERWILWPKQLSQGHPSSLSAATIFVPLSAVQQTSSPSPMSQSDNNERRLSAKWAAVRISCMQEVFQTPGLQGPVSCNVVDRLMLGVMFTPEHISAVAAKKADASRVALSLQRPLRTPSECCCGIFGPCSWWLLLSGW